MIKSGTGLGKSMGFGLEIEWTHLNWTLLDVEINWICGPTVVDTYGHETWTSQCERTFVPFYFFDLQ
jgi:hypothetical protein